MAKWWTPKRKKQLKQVAIWTTLGLITYETYLAAVVRRQKRRDLFNLALQRSQETGKPLLVIGDPRERLLNRLLGPDHDCADGCLTMEGCDTCPNTFAGPIFQTLSALGENTYVVYVSQQLESLDNIESSMEQLSRVAGLDLFVTHAEPYSLTAWLTPSAKRRILEAPPSAPYIAYRDLPWRPGKSVEKSFYVGEKLSA
jgi:hypothetical protein